MEAALVYAAAESLTSTVYWGSIRQEEEPLVEAEADLRVEKDLWLMRLLQTIPPLSC